MSNQMDKPIICPHCSNDDETMLEFQKIIVKASGKFLLYHCENCAKDFEVKK